MREYPAAYFLTFSTYGTRLHGDVRGSVDRNHNGVHEPTLLHNRALNDAEMQAMRDTSYILTERRRAVVADAFKETCTARSWLLLALHVRPTHVHLVVQGSAPPERIMRDLKAYASRRLAERFQEPPEIRRWTRHGSTRYLWTVESLEKAVRYVVDEQGRSMEVLEDTDEVDL